MSRDGENSQDWIGEWYDRHGAVLYRYALMILANDAAAADAVQHVFLMLVSGGRAKPLEEQHYLRRAIRNECFSTLRRRRRTPQSLDSDQSLLESLQADRDRPDDRIALERALRTLPPEQRETVHLKLFEGFTFEEMADLTSESVNTMKSRYRYALEKLRSSLAK
jgi:RNA polymerase sigma-70 factor (ECF subfamily)